MQEAQEQQQQQEQTQQQQQQPTQQQQQQKGYRKVPKEKTKTEENEIRVTSKGQIKKYLGYALRVLTKTDMKSLVIKATGNAIVKALILIEIVKRRVGDLHQINEIKSMEIIDEFEPIEEGLEKMEQKRRVTCLDCTLSKDPLQEDHIGYQPPQPKEANFTGGDRPRRPYNNNPNRQGGAGGPRRYNTREGGPVTGTAAGGERPFPGRGGRRYNVPLGGQGQQLPPQRQQIRGERRQPFNDRGFQQKRYNSPQRMDMPNPHPAHRGGRGGRHYNPNREELVEHRPHGINVIHHSSRGGRGGMGPGPRFNDDTNIHYGGRREGEHPREGGVMRGNRGGMFERGGFRGGSMMQERPEGGHFEGPPRGRGGMMRGARGAPMRVMRGGPGILRGGPRGGPIGLRGEGMREPIRGPPTRQQYNRGDDEEEYGREEVHTRGGAPGMRGSGMQRGGFRGGQGQMPGGRGFREEGGERGARGGNMRVYRGRGRGLPQGSHQTPQ